MRAMCKVYRTLGLSYSKASVYKYKRRLLGSKSGESESEILEECIFPLQEETESLSQAGKVPSLAETELVSQAGNVALLEETEPVSQAGKLPSPEETEALSQAEVQSFLDEQDMKYSEGYTCYKTTCPLHTVGTLHIAEVDKQFINAKTGYFVCDSCNKSGPWQSYKQNVENVLQHYKNNNCVPEYCFQNVEIPSETAAQRKGKLDAQNIYEDSVPLQSLDEADFEKLMLDLGIQGIKLSTLLHFNVKLLAEKNGIVIPLYGITGALVGVKTISHSPFLNKKNILKLKITQKTIPRTECHSLFGLDSIKSCVRSVTLTASEFDAMAIYQETGYFVLALPKGQNILYQQVLPRLEELNKITVWFGEEQPQSLEAAVAMTRKLNEKRCYLIRPSKERPSAFKAIQQEKSVYQVMKGERPVAHKSIVSFHDLRQEVFLEICEADKRAGVQWDRFPVMNKLLKGHRRGELTIFTGPTGAGKTTFISEYSLDLCNKGVNTLWGSFEINNARLLKTMITQFARKNLLKRIKEYDDWANKFEELPLRLMTFHGQENIKRVIETMSHAAYVYDVAHVIVDNLQFMMGFEDKDDRYTRQDFVIASFRKFATTMNCHVTLVVHPRKEKENELSMQSIFGSAKASQEADNVLILQDTRLTSLKGRKYIQVAKNRFDGELGVMLLKFDKDSRSYSLQKKKGKDPNDGDSTSETDVDDT